MQRTETDEEITRRTEREALLKEFKKNYDDILTHEFTVTGKKKVKTRIITNIKSNFRDTLASFFLEQVLLSDPFERKIEKIIDMDIFNVLVNNLPKYYDVNIFRTDMERVPCIDSLYVVVKAFLDVQLAKLSMPSIVIN